MADSASMDVKRFICFLGAIVLICASASPVQADTCPQSLISYWRLGETATPYLDQVGNHNATCTVCPTAASSGAIEGNGAQLLNNPNNNITVPSSAVYDWSASDSFSIELWMRKSATGNDEVMIARKGSTNQTLWKLGILADGRARFTLQASNGDSAVATGTKVLNNNIWHHIAAVRDRGTNDEIRLYVDGELERQVGHTYSAGFASNGNLTIGWIDDASTDRFSGLLDEIAIYGSALSETDIRAHYFLSRQYCGLMETPVRIMPLGDSITDDNQTAKGTSGNSYRKPLWDDLNANRFLVDFVGSQHNETTDFDNDHEGHPGYTDSQIATNVQSYLTANPADVILLHIGTNAFDTSAADVENILSNIDSFNSGKGQRITVVLARIIDWNPINPDVRTFNDNVAAMAATRISGGDKIIMVDMQDGAGLVYDYGYNGGDFVDGLHPNDNGYLKMSDQWYGRLDTALPMVEAPVITSSPVLGATLGQPYSYDVEATGNPAPTFSLPTHPGGMTIDPVSGVISWTPGAVGDEDVVVQVDNVGASWSSDTQSFTITVSENNSAPQITSAAPDSAIVATLYTYNATATDSDNDTLVWSKISGPAGLNIDSATGVVTWTPAEADIGTANCSIKVSDGKGGEDTQNFQITVTSNSNGGGGTDSDGGSSGGGGSGGCFVQSLL